MRKSKLLVALLIGLSVLFTGCGSDNESENVNEFKSTYPLKVKYAHWAGEDSKSGVYTVDAYEGLEFSINQRICNMIVSVEDVSAEKITLKYFYSDNEKNVVTLRLNSGESETIDTPSMDSGGTVTFTFGEKIIDVEQSEATDNLTDVKNMVEKINDICESTVQIIDWQIAGASEEIEAMKEALAKGEIYNNTTLDPGEQKEKYEELRSYIADLENIQEQIDSIPKSGYEPIDATYEAASKYSRDTLEALSDLNAIFVFNETVNGVVIEMNSKSSLNSSSAVKSIESVYYAVQDGYEAFKNVDCPDFMQQTYDEYCKQYKYLLAVVEEEYYGYANGDPLMIKCAEEIGNRVNLEAEEYRIMLNGDYNMQFNKVKERLMGDNKILHDELDSNIKALMEALEVDE